jgi:sec-independent protein translocase protein TatC
MDKLFLSMNSPSFWTFRKMCEWFGVCVNKIDIKMQSTEMSGQFSYALMMSVIGGIVVSFPFIFYQIWAFVKPGLRQREISAAKGIIFYVSLLFFTGIAFGYYLVAPLCVQFFGNYKISQSIENIFTISSYMSMVMSTVFYSGVLFLLPVVSYLMTKLGIVSSEFLKKYRKHAIVGVLILAALITPPDLISQIIVAIPIMILYEIGIFVSKRAEKSQTENDVKSHE